MRRIWAGLLAAVVLLMSIPAMAATETGKRGMVNDGGLLVTLEIDGVQLTGLRQVGALEAAVPDSSGCKEFDGICTAELLAALDELDATAAGVAERARHDTVKNSINNVRALAIQVGNGAGDLDGDGYPDEAAKTYRPGRPVFGTITVARSGLPDKRLHDWFRQAADGQDARKSGSIIYLDREGKEVARYTYFEAWPVAYQVHYDGSIVEELEFAVEKVERATAGRPGNAGGVGPAKSLVSLQLDGVEAGRFESTSPISATISHGHDQDCDGTDAIACSSGLPARCEDGACVASLTAALDALEAQIREVLPANADQLLSLVRRMRAPIPELNSALEGARRPGRTKYANVTLKRGLSSSTGVAQWINETVQGKPPKRSAVLVFLGPDGKEVARIDLGMAELERYAVEGQDGQPVERVTIRVPRIELK